MAQTGKRVEKARMRIFTRGTDRGNAAITALILIMALSSFFIVLTARISAAERFAAEYKARVILGIEESNREILSKYDFN